MNEKRDEKKNEHKASAAYVVHHPEVVLRSAEVIEAMSPSEPRMMALGGRAIRPVMRVVPAIAVKF